MSDTRETTTHHFLREPKTHAERIAHELRRSIARGELRPGEPLEIKALAQRLKISPIPVREALKQLEIEGFITIEAYRGPRVAELHAEEIIDFTDVRIALDSLALELAVPNMRDEDLARASEVLDALERTRDPGEIATLIHDFYLALYEPAGRAMLMRFVHLAGVAGMRYMYVWVPQVMGKRFDRKPYDQLLRACGRGDVDGAIKLLVTLRRRIQNGLFTAMQAHIAREDRRATRTAAAPRSRAKKVVKATKRVPVGRKAPAKRAAAKRARSR